MRLTGGHVRIPDVAFVSRERLPRTREPIPTLGLDLAVEVLSESNTPREMAAKLKEYFASGTRLAWLVDPATRTVAVHTTPGEPSAVVDEEGTLDGGEMLPGFSLKVAEMFRDLPRIE